MSENEQNHSLAVIAAQAAGDAEQLSQAMLLAFETLVDLERGLADEEQSPDDENQVAP